VIYEQYFRYLFFLKGCVCRSVAESHHFYADPAPGKNLDAAPGAPALAPTLLHGKAKFNLI
jgi:hypothetical protein